MNTFEAIEEESMAWFVGRLNEEHGLQHIADYGYAGSIGARAIDKYTVEIDAQGRSIKVFVAEMYEVSEADVEEILSAGLGVKFILTWGPWSSCTAEAKRLGKSRGVAVMEAREFLDSFESDADALFAQIAT